MIITNRDAKTVSLQISRMGNIPEEDFTSETGFSPEETFLLKNETDVLLTVKIMLASQTEWITTILFPGWNPELCRAVATAEPMLPEEPENSDEQNCDCDCDDSITYASASDIKYGW